jgi:Xaa-Pro aminopeptidase
MITRKEFARRRRQLMRMMGKDSIAIIPTSSEQVRNRDVEFPYRADSDFYYLTGFGEPDAVAVLIPRRKHGEYLLFCRERDPEMETWTGRRAGTEGAVEQFDADDAFPIGDIDEILPGLMEDREQVFYTMGSRPEFDKSVMEWVNRIRQGSRRGARTPDKFVALEHLLHDMRLYKSPAEVRAMRAAAKVACSAHRRAMQVCRPGMSEYQVEAELLHEFRAAGMQPAYPSIVGGGENAAAISQVQPGNHWNDPHEAAVKVLTRGLVKLGILKGRPADLIRKEAFRRFYMHRTGHWLGMDVHDVGDYKVGDAWRVLEPGMVLTVEPGLYIPSGSKGIAKKWWNLGIRIEDDVLVTKKGPVVLTGAVPSSIEEIENLMAAGNTAA